LPILRGNIYRRASISRRLETNSLRSDSTPNPNDVV